MATAPSPNDLTRQQLDELDALLQKMLTVPLAPVETPLPAAALSPLAQPPLPPSWRADPPTPMPAPALAQLAPTEPPPTLKFEPPAAPPAPKVAPVPVPMPAPKQEAPAPSVPKVAPVPAPKVAPAPAPKPVTPAPLPPASGAPVPLPAIPFVALNGLFDGICEMFGPPGRLFRSGFFKNLYGLTGLALIAYTALHIAQVRGLLTLPVQLPWPK